MIRLVRLATRGSSLALAQTREVARRLHEAHPDLETAEVLIHPAGDRDKESDLAGATSPGLFTKELEGALLGGFAEAAIHSLKDLPTVLPSGLRLAAVLPRANSADVLVSAQPGGLGALPAGACVGTGSPRRQAMLREARNDLIATGIRGNVPTRLVKLANEEYDAVILAAAGLTRLGFPAEGGLQIAGRMLHVSVLESFLPAPGQGAIAVEIRAGDAEMASLFSPLHDAATDASVRAEREVLRASGGGCHTALGARATMDGKVLHLEAVWFDEKDGTRHEVSVRGAADNPEALGREAAIKLHEN